MKYNNETLIDYCNLNNIVLIKTYDKLNKESYIEGNVFIMNVKIVSIKILDS